MAARITRLFAETELNAGFEGNFGAHHVTPRNLSSGLVNKLISINGIVTKCSLVCP
jgi:DNA replication licensing factor MCM3